MPDDGTNEFGKRLKQARIESGLTIKEAARRGGTQMASLWRYEAGQREPLAHIVYALAQVYRKPIEWFYGDELSPAAEALIELGITHPDGRPISVPVDTVRPINVIGAISAGGFVESWQDDLGTMDVPASVLEASPRAFALRVSGNSLAAEGIWDGAMVVVDPDAPVEDGKIYAIRRDGGEIAARRLFIVGRRFKVVSGDGDVLELTRSQVTVIGRIRWSFREH
jgi:SOS-response transcriptional repressor LexA